MAMMLDTSMLTPTAVCQTTPNTSLSAGIWITRSVPPQRREEHFDVWTYRNLKKDGRRKNTYTYALADFQSYLVLVDDCSSSKLSRVDSPLSTVLSFRSKPDQATPVRQYKGDPAIMPVS